MKSAPRTSVNSIPGVVQCKLYAVIFYHMCCWGEHVILRMDHFFPSDLENWFGVGLDAPLLLSPCLALPRPTSSHCCNATLSTVSISALHTCTSFPHTVGVMVLLMFMCLWVQWSFLLLISSSVATLGCCQSKNEKTRGVLSYSAVKRLVPHFSMTTTASTSVCVFVSLSMRCGSWQKYNNVMIVFDLQGFLICPLREMPYASS